MSLNKRASGNPVSKPCDLLKEIGTSFHHPFCKLIIAHLISDCIQFFKGYTRAQVTLSLGQRFQLLIWCRHLLTRISFPDLTFGVDNGHREETGAVEVDIRIEEVSIELVNQLSTPLGDISIS